ncbi:MAG: NADH-quinone oxidoreductase subunit NuoG, partial [Candidatus Eisenbacteria bacterium]|nr:NADH-quinone oxidoreductase subunit NuoG [Candidatus Eisenbacteria bacterium]
MEPVMAVIFIDGKRYEVREGMHLLQAALELGLNLPYFCWHPALGSVGACRQCAVKQFKDENDTQGKIVMACMTPAADGTRIAIEDDEAKAFRAAVLEWLMTSHPHDCPICDEGGECHLQDMTVMTGHTYRRDRFPKRTFRNQDLGPFINHEMNRCITCYRCVRFYRDYAGGDDLHAMAIRNRTYFGRMTDGTLESPFSGNLVEVCPTGVFTDKTLKQHYTRKWDLQTAPSVCIHCGLGCNTIAAERYGTLRRILNRYNHAVNGYFLCDRGRFGYEFAAGDRRRRYGRIKTEARADQDSPELSRDDLLKELQNLMKNASGVVGVGSPRASLESNFALRELVGAESFCNGLSASEAECVGTVIDVLRETPAKIRSLGEVERCDAVLVLGEDVANTAPRLDLALRQAASLWPRRKAGGFKFPEWDDAAVRLVMGEEKGPVYVVTPDATALDRTARGAYRADPERIARLGRAVAHALDAQAPAVANLAQEDAETARRIAEDLRGARRPLIVSGTGSLDPAILYAASDAARALAQVNDDAGIFLCVPEANTIGVALMERRDVDLAAEALDTGRADTLIVLENDLHRRLPPEAARNMLDGGRIVVVDHTETEASAAADLFLPAATFAEATGTYINNEARAQRAFQVYPPPEPVQASWRWLGRAAG